MARHYCYLDPADVHVERRVTSDVLFGNLIADLVDGVPELASFAGTKYAAGMAELESLLSRAGQLGKPVVIIVDGIDHISRVRSQSRSLSDDDTDIVEKIATIDVPPGISLIFGSQPGDHLNPIRQRWNSGQLIERTIPLWDTSDLVSLVGMHGAESALVSFGMTDPEEREGLIRSIAGRADGNPLYARALSRGLSEGIREGIIQDPREWIAEAPSITNDIAVYYDFLYASSSFEAQSIADVLGTIEFAVTEAELREILPPFVSGWLPFALAKLAPVLTISSGQGGIRIFHESFRRFMTEKLAKQGRSVAAAVEPVITWLKKRGFYGDAKSYRYLIPALQRAGYDSEILDLVDTSFVSATVAHGHAVEAVQRNLATAAQVAASRRDWRSLVRCVELHRAAFTCFEAAHDWSLYWKAYLHVFGPTALGERLLLDGRPTQSRSEGLLACSILDDEGGIAPWAEYLALDQEENDQDYREDHFDPSGVLAAGLDVDLAALHGRLRVGEKGLARKVYVFLRRCGDQPPVLYTRSIGARFARMLEPSNALALLRRMETAKVGDVSPLTVAIFQLGIADEYARLGIMDEVRTLAANSLPHLPTPELAVQAVLLGADRIAARRVAIEPSSIDIAVGKNDFISDASSVRSWVSWNSRSRIGLRSRPT